MLENGDKFTAALIALKRVLRSQGERTQTPNVFTEACQLAQTPVEWARLANVTMYHTGLWAFVVSQAMQRFPGFDEWAAFARKVEGRLDHEGPRTDGALVIAQLLRRAKAPGQFVQAAAAVWEEEAGCGVEVAQAMILQHLSTIEHPLPWCEGLQEVVRALTRDGCGRNGVSEFARWMRDQAQQLLAEAQPGFVS